MKRFCFCLTALLCISLLQLPAHASTALSGRIEGSCLEVTWNASCGGTGTLSVYQDGWPICVREVDCSGGSMSIALGEARGSYSLRLNTQNGCLTAHVESPKPAATATPVIVATSEPIPVATSEPTPVVTEEPPITAAPAQTASPAPTPVEIGTPEPAVTSTPAPTAAPTAIPTSMPKPTVQPTRAPQESSPALSGSSRSDLAAQVVQQVNEARAKQGLGILRVDSELVRAAAVRAGEIVRAFGHTRPDGSNWSTVSASAYGENIAKGQRTADKVMAAWMSSSGHRENILRASFGSIGVCAYVSGGVTYWVQLFGR